MTERRWIITLLAIGLTGLVVRVVYVVVQTYFQVFDAPFLAGDSRAYLGFASEILAGRGLSLDGTPSALAGPVYPIFLAALLASGLDPLGVGLVQSVLGALTVMLVGLATLELGRATGSGATQTRVLALGSAMVACVYPHLVLWTGYILTETLFLFLGAGAVVLTLVADHRRWAWAALAAGLFAAAATLTRSAFMALALLAAIAWGVAAFGDRRRLVLVGLFVLAFMLPHAVWVVRNVRELGTPIVTVTQSGASLYQGNARGVSGGTGGYLDAREIPPLALPPGLTEVERDRAHQQHALADMGADPVAVVARWPAKLWNMWRPAYGDASVRNVVVSVLTYIPTVALGAAGALALARRRGRSLAHLPLIFLVGWVTTHMVLVGLIRYRVPAELILIATAPFGVEVLLRTLRNVAMRGRP